MKRGFVCLLLLAVLLGLTGCADGGPEERADRVSITMHLWDKSMCRELTLWLEQQFPEIDFTFVVGYNTMDYYTDLYERGALPDIITCRRFSLNDASHMSGMLMDLSRTEPSTTAISRTTARRAAPSAGCRCARRWTDTLPISTSLSDAGFPCRPTMQSSRRPAAGLRSSVCVPM